MFGCVVAGRLLQTNLTQVDDTHAYFELPAASAINHLTVFLLGTVPFPDGYGATVHFFWPGKGFQLLGMLSNEKPSAIFRLRGTFTQSSTATPAHSAFSNTGNTTVMVGGSEEVTAVLGLAIEPLASIQSQMSLLPSSSSLTKQQPVPDPALLAERIVKHMFNYLSSFVSGGKETMMAAETGVPMGLVVKWYESFVNKVRVAGVGFLERGD